MLARMATGPERAGRSASAGLPRARRQWWRWAALGCRADQKWPVYLPEAHALATRDSVHGAAGRQDVREDNAATPAGTAGSMAMELAKPGSNAGFAAQT